MLSQVAMSQETSKFRNQNAFQLKNKIDEESEDAFNMEQQAQLQYFNQQGTFFYLLCFKLSKKKIEEKWTFIYSYG